MQGYAMVKLLKVIERSKQMETRLSEADRILLDRVIEDLEEVKIHLLVLPLAFQDTEKKLYQSVERLKELHDPKYVSKEK